MPDGPADAPVRCAPETLEPGPSPEVETRVSSADSVLHVLQPQLVRLGAVIEGVDLSCPRDQRSQAGREDRRVVARSGLADRNSIPSGEPSGLGPLDALREVFGDLAGVLCLLGQVERLPQGVVVLRLGLDAGRKCEDEESDPAGCEKQHEAVVELPAELFRMPEPPCKPSYGVLQLHHSDHHSPNRNRDLRPLKPTCYHYWTNTSS